MLGGVQTHPKRLFLSALSIGYWGQHWVVAQPRNLGALLDASLQLTQSHKLASSVTTAQ